MASAHPPWSLSFTTTFAATRNEVRMRINNMLNAIKKIKWPSIGDVLLTIIGATMCGFGVGLTNWAALGLDAIGVFQDGVRNVMGLPNDQLGVAVNLINVVIVVFLLIFARKYVSVGTIVYFIFFGIFIDLATRLCNMLFPEPVLVLRIGVTTVGLLILYIGLGLYIAIDIGVDTFTGVVLFIRDHTKLELKYVKIIFDVAIFVIGALLGGTLGVATLVSASIGGPCIQFFSTKIQKINFKMKLKDYKEI